RVAGHLRVAFEVEDATAVTDALAAAGADVIAPPTRTPWNSLNARLSAPADLQITIFAELGDPEAGKHVYDWHHDRADLDSPSRPIRVRRAAVEPPARHPRQRHARGCPDVLRGRESGVQCVSALARHRPGAGGRGASGH